MERADSGMLPSLSEGSTGSGVVELTSETTMHITSDQCCSIAPSDGIVIGQLFPVPYSEAASSVAPASSPMVTATDSKASLSGFMDNSKQISKVREWFVRREKGLVPKRYFVVLSYSCSLSLLYAFLSVQFFSHVQLTCFFLSGRSGGGQL